MKKLFFSALALMMSIFTVSAESVWNGGSDTEWQRDAQGRYIISTADELAGLAVRVNAGEAFNGETFVLTDDINLNNIHDWTPIGTWTGLDCGGTTEKELYFSGYFDGQGHTVSNYYIYYDKDFDTGFFGWTKAKEVRLVSGLFGAINGATITNLTVRNSYIYHSTGHYCNAAGAIVGFSKGNSVITNCSAINNNITVKSLYKYSGVNIGDAYAGAVCGASGDPNTVNGMQVDSDASVTNCTVAGNSISAVGKDQSKPTDVVNGTSSETNSVYGSEGAMAADKDAIARKNLQAIYENVVNNANPSYCLWDEETGLLTDKAVYRLNTTAEVVGGGNLTIYSPTAVEYTFDGVTYQTITSEDYFYVEGREVEMPTREKNGYRMRYYKCLAGGKEFVHCDVVGAGEFSHSYTGATGNVTVQCVSIANYLVDIETNGVSTATINGYTSYVANENDWITVSLNTNTVYETDRRYRYYTIKSITMNGEDVLAQVNPGEVSLYEFTMPASSVVVRVEFEEVIVDKDVIAATNRATIIYNNFGEGEVPATPYYLDENTGEPTSIIYYVVDVDDSRAAAGSVRQGAAIIHNDSKMDFVYNDVTYALYPAGNTVTVEFYLEGYSGNWGSAGFLVGDITDANGVALENSLVSVVGDDGMDENGNSTWNAATDRFMRKMCYEVTVPTANTTICYTTTIPTSVEGVESDNRIYTAGGYVVVEAATAGNVTIVDMAGRIVYNGLVKEGRNEIALERGFYVVNGVKVVL